MLIDVEINKITINAPSSELRGHHINQIKYWGFVREPHQNSYRHCSTDIEHLLPKLLKYLEKEEIDYSVTPACQKYLSTITQKQKNFEKIKVLGREYKDGKFDSAKFDEFTKFVDKNIKRKLRPHQMKAAYHLYLLGNGANFSVPGSGKTTVILSVYEKLKSEDKVNLLFIVGPPACFGPWRTEFAETFGQQPKWRILAGGNQIARKSEYFSPASQKTELYLTTFQTLLNDQKEVVTFLQRQGVKAFLVIDEAHYVKQVDGNWAKSVLGIAKYARYKCVLTGTPLPRSYTDVFNLFDFLWPDDNPIDSNTKIRVQMHEENHDITTARNILKETIGPLFYRVRKSELGLMPPSFHAPYVLSMNKYERTIYHAIEDKIRTYSEQDYLKNIDLVRKLRRGRIIRLRQCVSYTKLLSQAVVI